MAVSLATAQQAVVDHRGGPLVVAGGFGSGKSTALRARAERLRAEGHRPLVMSAVDDAIGFVGWSLELLRCQGRYVQLLDKDEQLAIVAALTDRNTADSARAVIAYQASFLGDEELRTHADSAGAGGEAEELIDLTRRYLAVLEREGRIDAGGVRVAASLALRDPDVLAEARADFDEVLIDDYQTASFADARLLAQLVGPDGPVVVVGNPAAAVSDDPLSSASHFERFARRFGADTVSLNGNHRHPAPPTLRIVLDEVAVAEIIDQEMAAGDGMILNRGRTPQVVGRESGTVVAYDATEGRWPAPRPAPGWFDLELLHGPDVPDDDERDRRWAESERRRFAVATSRATRRLVVLAEIPVSPLVADLVREG